MSNDRAHREPGHFDTSVIPTIEPNDLPSSSSTPTKKRLAFPAIGERSPPSPSNQDQSQLSNLASKDQTRSKRYLSDSFDVRPTKSKRSGGFLLSAGFASLARRGQSSIRERSAYGHTKSPPQPLKEDNNKSKDEDTVRPLQDGVTLVTQPYAARTGQEGIPPATPERGNVINGKIRLSSSHQSESSSTAAVDLSRSQSSSMYGQYDGSLPRRNEEQASPSTIDATQLVRMALSLGESRKLQLGPGRLASPPTTSNRVVSVGRSASSHDANTIHNQVQSTPSTPNHASSSSRNASLRDTLPPDTPQSSFKQTSYSPILSAAYPTLQHYDYPLSPSTLERAEKAKISFEIFNDYLRLLEYLPPLIPREQNSSFHENKLLGRKYNPLQCIRNRRVRAREQQTLDSDASGWARPSDVRQWVNATQLSSSKQDFFRGDSVRLPIWGNASPGHKDATTAQKARQKNDALQKSKRPLANWSINREDFLADCYWLESGNNKTLIEDSHGNLIFPEFERPSSVSHSSDEEEEEYEGENSHTSATRDRRGTFSSFEVPHFKSHVSPDNHRLRRSGTTLIQSGTKGRAKRQLLGRSRTYSDSGTDLSESDHEMPTLPSNRRWRNGSRENVGPLERHMHKMIEIEQSKEHEKSPVERVGSRDSDGGRRMGMSEGAHRARSRTGSLARMQTFEQAFAQSEEDKVQPLPRSSTVDQTGKAKRSDVTRNGTVSTFNSLSQERLDRQVAEQPKHRLPRLHLRRHRRTEDEQGPHSLVTPESSRPSSRDIDVSLDNDSQSSARSSLDVAPHTKAPNGLPRVAELSQQKERSTSRDKNSRRLRDSASNSTAKSIFKSSRVAELAKETRSPGYLSRLSGSATGSASSSQSKLNQAEAPGKHHAHRKGQPSLDATRPSVRAHGRSMSADNLNDANEHASYRHEELPTFVSSQTRDRTGASGFLKRVDTRLDDFRRSRSPIKSQRSSPKAGHAPRLELPESSDVSPNNSSFNLLKAAQRNRRGLSPGFGTNGASDSDSDVRSTSSRLNKVLGVAGAFGADYGKPRTGLASFETNNHRRSSVSPGARPWEVDRTYSRSPGRKSAVTLQDIAYARSLLIACSVKGHSILAKADSIRDPPSNFLVRAAQACGKTVEPASYRHEHVVVARMLSEQLQTTMHGFEADTARFRSETARALYEELGDARDTAGTRLMNRVRNEAGEAEAFVARLTSAHTLAVKQVNDRVDAALRGRRKRLRWLARAGWALLEQCVVSIMWLIWLLVLVVRCARWLLRLVFSVARWLLWL